MMVRNITLVTFATLSLMTTGCTGMRTCLFGRGARCGLCSRLGAVGNSINPFSKGSCLRGPAVAPPCGTPYAPVAPPYYGPQVSAPIYGNPVHEPAYVGGPSCCGPTVAAGDIGCQSCGGGYAVGMGIDSGCSSCNQGVVYQGGDPYLQSGTIIGPGYGGASMGGMPYMGDSIYQGDNFQPRSYQSRKVDSQGDTIISEDPLPPGAQLVN